MKTCPQCHATHPDDINLCPVDGATLVEAEGLAGRNGYRGEIRILTRVGQDAVCIVYKALHVKPANYVP